MADERLREIVAARQHAGDPGRRRWFTCASADLYVWEDGPDRTLMRFEFCYHKARAERVLAWDRTQGLHHAAIDDGERLPFDTSTPIAVPDGLFDAALIALEFERLAASLEPRVFRFVLARLLQAV